jgi:hypothetical protein
MQSRFAKGEASGQQHYRGTLAVLEQRLGKGG